MKKLSKYLGVKEIDFKVNGIFDISDVPFDDRYFIDVFRMKGTNIPEFENSYTAFLEYFSDITDLLAESSSLCDESWVEANSRLLFREIQGLFFGFSHTIGKGNGVGKVFAAQMTKAANAIVKKGVTHPEAFLFAPFLEDDIGFDRISDMVASILFNDFASYTQRICKDLKIKKNLKEVKGKGGEVFKLPWYVNKAMKVAFPIIFCPQAFSRRIPGNFDWENPFDFYMDDGSYKKKINQLIGKQFGNQPFAKKEVKKSNLKDALFESRDVFEKIVEKISKTTAITVTLREEAEGFVNTVPVVAKVSKAENIYDQIKFICEQFKFQVEHKGQWKAFYKSGYHLNEEHIQSYFYFMASAFCDVFETDLFPEHHTGTGRVDFRVSHTGVKPVLVEVKLSFHPRLFHGYEKQLPSYLHSEKGQRGIYLVVKMLDKNNFFIEKKEKKKKEILEESRVAIDLRIEELKSKQHEGSIPCEQIIVDAIPQLPSSKK